MDLYACRKCLVMYQMNPTLKSFSPSYFDYLAASILTQFETLILAPTSFKAYIASIVNLQSE